MKLIIGDGKNEIYDSFLAVETNILFDYYPIEETSEENDIKNEAPLL